MKTTTVRLTDDEWQTIKDASKRSGRSMSWYFVNGAFAMIKEDRENRILEE